MNPIDKLIKNRKLTKDGYVELLNCIEKDEMAVRITDEAVLLRKKYYGNKVYTRGLIEFTNYCRNNCFYCGIRRDNQTVSRYRLSLQEILSCCQRGYELGFRTFVLQGGEDPYFTDERMVKIIYSVKERYPDCALTLSIGEKTYDSYRRFREAGADRYLLRHETADQVHYRKIHPKEMSLAVRKQCLYHLKTLGYQVGAGFMVGSPGQTYRELAQDLVFLQELQPQMVGIGPFIPHHSTRFAEEPPGSVKLTLRLLSIVRILLPQALIPATTALGTLDPEGREKGLAAGGNVVMPKLSPAIYQKKYELYDGEEAVESMESLARRVEAIGYRLTVDRGDFVPTESI
ncbi:MAG: [FeFe] hydrogenase H-cluster radical SAM maturase HydE [Lachnospiraceae bacterium]|nr:[FeFe] hydrogenase H-cluster radical SAM maturase HydE [Lachnospiraceae bacterium]